MRYSRSIVSFAVCAALAAGNAFAQAAPPPQPRATPSTMPAAAPAGDSDAPAFSELSKNGKFIKRSDIPKDNPALNSLRAHFSEADKDHSGSVDQGEYEAAVHAGDQPPERRQ